MKPSVLEVLLDVGRERAQIRVLALEVLLPVSDHSGPPSGLAAPGCGVRDEVSAAARYSASEAVSLISPTPASARLTMQPAFAPSAAALNAASSLPGTRPTVSSSIVVIVGVPSSEPQRHARICVDRLDRRPRVRECRRQCHREARRERRPDQLFGVRAGSVLEARLERIVAAERVPCGERPTSRLQLSLPFSMGVCRHRCSFPRRFCAKDPTRPRAAAQGAPRRPLSKAAR